MGGGISPAARRVALGGVFTALSLVFLYAASAAPTGQLGLAAVAGLFPMAAVISAGWRLGLLCWAASSLLALLVVPAKGTVLLFLLFFGVYPVVKSRIERLRRLLGEWVLKLVFFNADLALCLYAAGEVLMDSVPEGLRQLWALWLAANLVFAVYDVGLSKLAQAYRVRVDRQLRK